MKQLSDKIYQALKAVDTPTVCNAIDIAWGKRGFANFTRKTLFAAVQRQEPLVGFARTAKLEGLNPPSNTIEDIKTKRMAYYKYMSEGTRPSIAVVQDLDYPNCVAAYWGEVNANIHQSFDISGVLTNGVMRDLDCLPEGFQVLAASIGPSHMFVNVVDIDCKVELFNMQVAPGDLIHADKHGAMVIPADVIADIDKYIGTVFEREKLILDPIRGKKISFAEFEKLWDAFEKARV